VTHPAAEAIRVTALVTEALQKLGIHHVVAGSLASSIHGIPRSTNDADIVAALRQEHVAPFTRSLEATFYVDGDMIADAIARHGEFNIIHLATMFKVDVFVPVLDEVSRAELDRGAIVVLDTERDIRLRVASAEDTVAQKLRWYRAGNEISERQWHDVLGIIAVQGDRLDRVYLRRTAVALRVEDLLDRALAEAAQAPPSP
jgi:hypothetical protein